MDLQEIIHQLRAHQNYLHTLNMDKFMLVQFGKGVARLNLKELGIENMSMN